MTDALVEVFRFFRLTREPTIAAVARMSAQLSETIASGRGAPPKPVRVAMRAVANQCVVIGKGLNDVLDALENMVE